MKSSRGIAASGERGRAAEATIPFTVLVRIAGVVTDRRLTSDERVALIGLLVSLEGTPRDDKYVGDTWHEADIRFASKTLGWSPQRLKLAWRSLEAKGFMHMEKGQVADVRYHLNLSGLA